ncbi:MAG: phosphoribosyltransferase family protein [Bacteroidia bacterium]
MLSQILDSNKVNQKIKRIALEIIERTYSEEHVVIVGIESSGFELAKRICLELEHFESKKFPCFSIKINKPSPLDQPISTNVNTSELGNSVVIIIDDVQNSGKTMAYAVKYFLQFPVKAIQTCVLIDRRHNRFPVRADYVGLSLSTTLKEHVSVETTGKDITVSLN